jgi:hypothetical protein
VSRIPLPRTPNRLDEIPGQSSRDEQFMAMIVSLASEATILRARLDACERLLVQAGVLAGGAVDGYDPDPEAQAARDAQRMRMLHKIFRPLEEAAAADLAAASATAAQQEKTA